MQYGLALLTLASLLSCAPRAAAPASDLPWQIERTADPFTDELYGIDAEVWTPDGYGNLSFGCSLGDGFRPTFIIDPGSSRYDDFAVDHGGDVNVRWRLGSDSAVQDQWSLHGGFAIVSDVDESHPLIAGLLTTSADRMLFEMSTATTRYVDEVDLAGSRTAIREVLDACSAH